MLQLESIKIQLKSFKTINYKKVNVKPNISPTIITTIITTDKPDEKWQIVIKVTEIPACQFYATYRFYVFF